MPCIVYVRNIILLWIKGYSKVFVANHLLKLIVQKCSLWRIAYESMQRELTNIALFCSRCSLLSWSRSLCQGMEGIHSICFPGNIQTTRREMSHGSFPLELHTENAALKLQGIAATLQVLFEPLTSRKWTLRHRTLWFLFSGSATFSNQSCSLTSCVLYLNADWGRTLCATALLHIASDCTSYYIFCLLFDGVIWNLWKWAKSLWILDPVRMLEISLQILVR